jgi:AraC family transcriptional regulator, transcriptional activator of pobA
MPSEGMIPVFSFDETAYNGFFITKYHERETASLTDKDIHRDDHYIFIVQEQGSSRLMLDFRELTIEGTAALCILPGQVHKAIAAQNTIAWFIAARPAFINEVHRAVFIEHAATDEACTLNTSTVDILQQILPLFLNTWSVYKSGQFNTAIIRSLADAIFGIIAHQYQDIPLPGNLSRSQSITRSFKALLCKNYRQHKAPSDYAHMLSISKGHLSDAVREVTGFPPTYWIQQEIVIEARRALFFTDLSVKEISVMLGFEDHNYFSRLFTKLCGLSPQHFRQHSRK